MIDRTDADCRGVDWVKLIQNNVQRLLGIGAIELSGSSIKALTTYEVCHARITATCKPSILKQRNKSFTHRKVKCSSNAGAQFFLRWYLFSQLLLYSASLCAPRLTWLSRDLEHPETDSTRPFLMFTSLLGFKISHRRKEENENLRKNKFNKSDEL
jgi:hypothetical protein